MKIGDSILIIADDLTGANDTALQYFKNGCKTKVIIDYNEIKDDIEDVEVWAISTETRNIDKEVALEKVVDITQTLQKSLNTEKIYKKIDSTLRGNTGVEILGILQATQKDAAIVAPAYIEEKRTTLGAYQLLDGVPIERTQCAYDPKAPIYDSYIPDILKKDLNPQYQEFIGKIEFKTISKGAGPISLKINELISKGKKIIITDACSKTDLEQIALAITKSNYSVLPCASAGLANAFNKILDRQEQKPKIAIKHVPNLPRLILSGSATKLTQTQIQELKQNEKIYFIDLTIEDVLDEIKFEMVDVICDKLNQGIDVVVHSSNLIKNKVQEEITNALIDKAIAKEELPNKITDFISNLAYEIDLKSKYILVIIGGETSFKCTQKLSSNYLQIIDAIAPAIPLCVDSKGRIIVTKSGNFGNQKTLVEVINFFENLKEEQNETI